MKLGFRKNWKSIFVSFSVFAPYCGEYNKNYNTAPVVTPAYAVDKYDKCAEDCSANTACKSWYLTVTNVGATKMCELRGEIPAAAAAVAVNDPTLTAFFGKTDCIKGKTKPALAEDAEELSYKETCQENQYQEQIIWNNTWSRTYCPSPCKDNGECPKYSQCMDTSTDEKSDFECICQMGMVMEGGRCIDPPPTTPTPRPSPELPSGQETFAKTITRTSYFLLIACCAASLLIFLYFRILNPGRFIHMNIEIALLIAHVCLMFDFDGKKDPVS